MSPNESTSAGDGNFYRVVINAIPDPIFVVDGDVRIQDCNTAAADILGDAPERAFGCRAGDALDCTHAVGTDACPGKGCGTGPACRDCVIRNSVSLALKGDQPRRARHKLETVTGNGTAEVQLLITTAPIEYHGRDLVLLVLEDVSELIALRRILPICAHCHRVRDDREYWQNVESYCRRQLDIEFSHGICPDCLHRHYPEWEHSVERPSPRA